MGGVRWLGLSGRRLRCAGFKLSDFLADRTAPSGELAFQFEGTQQAKFMEVTNLPAILLAVLPEHVSGERTSSKHQIVTQSVHDGVLQKYSSPMNLAGLLEKSSSRLNFGVRPAISL
jgi:hypothetical protein